MFTQKGMLKENVLFISPNIQKERPLQREICEQINSKLKTNYTLQEKIDRSAKSDADHRKDRLYVYLPNLGGRLGNQMFHYASSLGIAMAQGRRLAGIPTKQMDDTFRFVRFVI